MLAVGNGGEPGCQADIPKATHAGRPQVEVAVTPSVCSPGHTPAAPVGMHSGGPGGTAAGTAGWRPRLGLRLAGTGSHPQPCPTRRTAVGTAGLGEGEGRAVGTCPAQAEPGTVASVLSRAGPPPLSPRRYGGAPRVLARACPTHGTSPPHLSFDRHRQLRPLAPLPSLNPVTKWSPPPQSHHGGGDAQPSCGLSS